MSGATEILALDIFDMAAYFAPGEIQIGIFSYLALDQTQLKESIEHLQRQSLVEMGPEEETFVISETNQARHREYLKRLGKDKIVLKKTISLLNKEVIPKNYSHALSVYEYAKMHHELLKDMGMFPGYIVGLLNLNGKYDEAVEFGKECYEFLTKFLGEYDETILYLQMSMGRSLMHLKKKEEAIEMLKVVHSKNFHFSARYNMVHYDTLRMLAEFILKNNPEDAAEIQLRRIFFPTRKISESFKDFELRMWILYAKSISDYNFFSTALSIFEDVIRQRKRTFGPNDAGISDAIIEMAECFVLQSRFQEALKLLQNTYKERKSKFDILSVQTINIKFLMGKIYKKQGELEKSLSIFEEVAKQFQTVGDMVQYLNSVNEIASTCILQKKFERALKLSVGLYNKFVKDYGTTSPILFEGRMIIGESLLGLNQTKRALKVFLDLLDDYNACCFDDEMLEKLKFKIQLIKNMEFTAPEGTLHSFAKEGNLAEVLSVIANGGDINAKHTNDKTPLHYASSFEKVDVARLLIKHGAKYLTKLPSDEFRPLRGSEMYALLENVRSFFDSVKAGDTNKLIEVTLKETCLFGARDDQGCTGLHWAALRGHVGVLKVLLELGCDPTVVSDKGNSPLHIAASKGHVEIAEAILRSIGPDKVTALLDGRTGSGGNTPLHAAAEKGHQGMVKALLVHGAVFCPVNAAGMTPIQLCKDSEYRNFLMLVENLFLSTKNGEVESVSKMLEDLKKDDVLTVSRARNEAQRTLMQVAMECKHLEMAKSLVKLLM